MRTPVLIVGGGGSGLAASMFLSTYGIESVLVNDRETTSKLPKAHMLNQRTMEMFEEVGLAQAVYEHGTPAHQMRATGWYAGFGTGRHSGRLIGKIEAWGAGYEDPEYVAASACRSANLPQMNLEPLMLARAIELAGGERVRFNHEVLEVGQDDNEVRALIRDNASGASYEMTADYVIGADAGRTVGPATVFMTVDLSQWIWDEDVVSYHLINTDATSNLEAGTLLATGPDHWGPKSEQWYFHLMYPVGDQAAFDDDAVVARMLSVLGLPELSPQIHVINRWTIYGAMADRFRSGRCFVVGDAAHRNPPMGGLGLNSAIGDVANLCWKIAEVLQHRASAALLNSYELERRPFCQEVIARALANSRRGVGLHEAIGLSQNKSPAENVRALEEVWSDAPAHAAKRRAVRSILQRHSMDFRDLNIEVGLAYSSSPAIIPESSPEPETVDPVRIYQPTTRPGYPLPHAWVDDGRERVSLRHLATGRWLLICGEAADDWLAAGNHLAEGKLLPLAVIQVGHAEGDWFDVRCAWLKQREIGPQGCVLARPDRYVAWRSFGTDRDTLTTLRGVLRRLGLQLEATATSTC